VDTITLPSEYEIVPVTTVVPPPLAEVGTPVTYYEDKTPSALTLDMEQPVTEIVDGIVGIYWTDRTANQYYTRVLRKSGNSWFVAGQVGPGTSKFSISGFTVPFLTIDIGVQSLNTPENFTSQITYDTIFISGAI
jgi:hypothetical protein